ncbi:hypothetical protein DL769_010031 [Monosporascus sp. CRB-8-3]|nr:hypothetical protein DL769_010031 [Monosporascus sp. CRB-8-3]
MPDFIYDLDNQYLPYYYWQHPPSESGHILCYFRAFSSPFPSTELVDLSQFGTIISETPERLEIHLMAEELDRMHDLKQAWVSKYVEEEMICFLRLGGLEPDYGRFLVFQQAVSQQGEQEQCTEPNPNTNAPVGAALEDTCFDLNKEGRTESSDEPNCPETLDINIDFPNAHGLKLKAEDTH